ncbi:hypothetical protein [Marixanthomonas spongiae]|uniref:DUF3325 domain-containing protein n=1 Tax=Marixanthomonas spongiae TaxID=2174845 RepID=A0A2U0I3B9_9FLAO|nr:hypothetical protein [Marixanthomonas spongiae]PVW15589.1 hypothetical protein DDV96_04785 [Marixanthomonas spongiae]
MITTTILFTVLGFYLLLLASKRAAVPARVPERELALKNKQVFKISGVVLLLIAFVAGSLFWGLVAGIISEFIILSIVASLAIILVPLQLINYKQMTVIFILSFIFEVYLTYAS